MEKGAKIFLGFTGLAVLSFGGWYIYNKLSIPSLVSYDNLSKAVTYKFKGKTNVAKLDKASSFSLGSDYDYTIEPRVVGGSVVGADLKKNNNIIDSL